MVETRLKVSEHQFGIGTCVEHQSQKGHGHTYTSTWLTRQQQQHWRIQRHEDLALCSSGPQVY